MVNAKQVRKAMGNLIAADTVIYNNKRQGFRSIKLYNMAGKTDVEAITRVFKKMGAYDVTFMRMSSYCGQVVDIVAKFKHQSTITN